MRRANDWDAAADAVDGPAASVAMGRPPAAPIRAVDRDDAATRRREWREAAQQKHKQSLRSMAESLHLARETAHTVSMQSEQLGRNERAVEEAQYAVDLSKRVMRGMTWSGWIANAFTAPPQVESERRASKPDASGVGKREEITMGFICPDCKIIFKNPEQLGAHYAKTHEHVATPGPSASSGQRRQSLPSGASTTKQAQQQQQGPPQRQTEELVGDVHDAFLRELEPQLAELKEASLSLGNALDTQNRQLDRLDDKIDHVHDGMKRVSVQAKKLTGRRLPVTYRFRCAFQEVQSRRFIRDVDGEAILGADVLVDGCTFRAYTLGDDTELWGFQSETSSFFLGINRFGMLKIRGGDLQSYEQFSIELAKPTTTLFCFASYFGYGGWVVRKEDHTLSLVRGSPENKSAAAQFKLINLDQIEQDLAAK